LLKQKNLLDALQNFHTSVEEITMVATPAALKLKSYFASEQKVPNKSMYTELTIGNGDFLTWEVDESCLNSNLTFCLKEVKAILAFADTGTMPVTIHFDKCGRPIIFSVNFFDQLEANFVLATLLEPATPMDVDQSSTPTTKTETTSRNSPPSPNASNTPLSNTSSISNLSNISNISNISGLASGPNSPSNSASSTPTDPPLILRGKRTIQPGEDTHVSPTKKAKPNPPNPSPNSGNAAIDNTPRQIWLPDDSEEEEEEEIPCSVEG